MNHIVHGYEIEETNLYVGSKVLFSQQTQHLFALMNHIVHGYEIEETNLYVGSNNGIGFRDY